MSFQGYVSVAQNAKISDSASHASACDQTSFDGVKLVLDAAKDAGVQDRKDVRQILWFLAICSYTLED